MERIEIQKDEPLNPGDIIELHFKAWGPDWFKAIQAAAAEKAVESRDEFKIISADYWQPEKVIFTVEIQKTNPVVVTVTIILAALAITAVAFGWMFEKAYKISESPTAKVGSFALVGIAALILFYFLAAKKK